MLMRQVFEIRLSLFNSNIILPFLLLILHLCFCWWGEYDALCAHCQDKFSFVFYSFWFFSLCFSIDVVVNCVWLCRWSVEMFDFRFVDSFIRQWIQNVYKRILFVHFRCCGDAIRIREKTSSVYFNYKHYFSACVYMQVCVALMQNIKLEKRAIVCSL